MNRFRLRLTLDPLDARDLPSATLAAEPVPPPVAAPDPGSVVATAVPTLVGAANRDPVLGVGVTAPTELEVRPISINVGRYLDYGVYGRTAPGGAVRLRAGFAAAVGDDPARFDSLVVRADADGRFRAPFLRLDTVVPGPGGGTQSGAEMVVRAAVVRADGTDGATAEVRLRRQSDGTYRQLTPPVGTTVWDVIRVESTRLPVAGGTGAVAVVATANPPSLSPAGRMTASTTLLAAEPVALRPAPALSLAPPPAELTGVVLPKSQPVEAVLGDPGLLFTPIRV